MQLPRKAAVIPVRFDADVADGKLHIRCEADAGWSTKVAAVVVYPDADHAFHADYRPTYNAQAAKDGWTRTLDWFRQHGVA